MVLTAHASAEDVGNLQETLFLSIGCRMKLLENVLSKHSLVNGAFGTVHKIICQDGKARHRAPFVLLVRFDDYASTGFLRTENSDILVPIFISTREFFRGNNSFHIT